MLVTKSHLGFFNQILNLLYAHIFVNTGSMCVKQKFPLHKQNYFAAFDFH